VSWRTPITLLVLLGVLLGAAFYGWQTIISPATEDDSPPSAGKPHCDKVQEFHQGQLIRANDIIVNVFNSGLIGGLASETLHTLRDRGFKAGVSDNAPDGVAATNVSIITDSRDSPPVRLVANQFKGVVRFVKGADLGPGIDIVVGDSFAGIDKSAKRSLRLHRNVNTCASVDTAPS
jgi:hypothetical protein